MSKKKNAKKVKDSMEEAQITEVAQSEVPIEVDSVTEKTVKSNKTMKEKNIKPAKKPSKAAAFVVMLLRSIYAFVLMLVLLVTSNVIYAEITQRQTSVFGYSLVKIESESMVASGFKRDDYVVTKKVVKAEEIESGDFISFYVDDSFVPVASDDKETKRTLVFHEVIEINAVDGTFVTKGSSNEDQDPNSILFDSVAGVYEKTNSFQLNLIKLFLAEGNFIYWIFSLIIIAFIWGICKKIARRKHKKLIREVMSGKRNLLDKKCFDVNIFTEFKLKEKKKLVRTAPHGMELLYEYLLFERIRIGLDKDLIAKIKDKRCDIVDIINLTYTGEKNAAFDKSEYIETLPSSKKHTSYQEVLDFDIKTEREKKSIVAKFIGCFVFAIAYLAFAFFTQAFALVAWYEIVAIIAIPTVIEIYLLLSVLEITRNKIKNQENLIRISNIPKRYQFIIDHKSYTATEICDNESSIRRHLLGEEVEEVTNNAQLLATKTQKPIQPEPSITYQYTNIEDDTALPIAEKPLEVIEEPLNVVAYNPIQDVVAYTPIQLAKQVEPEKPQTVKAPEKKSVPKPRTVDHRIVDPKAELAATSSNAENVDDVEVGSRFHPLAPSKPRYNNGRLQAGSMPSRLD